MSQALNDLLQLLNLEKLEECLFRGNSEHIGLPQVFGGQVIGQALSASRYTVPDDRTVHSMHSYFLYPGDPEKPIIYDVDKLRDGRSFSTRRVKAIQNGKPIFYLTASYHVDAPGFEHQDPMPDIPGPENYVSEQELLKKYVHLLPQKFAESFMREKAIEVRPVNVIDPISPQKADPKQYLWIKATGELPKDQLMHQYLLGYASDWGFLTIALHPHGVSLMTPNFQVATIDHSIWYHRPFAMDEWLLFAIESPTASNTRGLVRGQIFNQQGTLVASAIQEGVMRYRDY